MYRRDSGRRLDEARRSNGREIRGAVFSFFGTGGGERAWTKTRKIRIPGASNGYIYIGRCRVSRTVITRRQHELSDIYIYIRIYTYILTTTHKRVHVDDASGFVTLYTSAARKEDRARPDAARSLRFLFDVYRYDLRCGHACVCVYTYTATTNVTAFTYDK